MKPVALVPIVLSVVASACTQHSAAGVERELPPLQVATTTTTSTAPELIQMDGRTADLAAQAELEAGLEVARGVYKSRATFDASIAELNTMGQGRVFVGLQDAASVSGVVYDAHDQRVTLYRESASATWFCIDEEATAETDYGLGDTFETALADCNDGITSVGWRNVFAANGLDESAIENRLIHFDRSVEEGDVSGAHGTFHPRRACAVEDLMAVWPDGRGLGDRAELELINVAINGDAAAATINLGEASELIWDLDMFGDSWYLSADACEILVPLARDGQDAQARQLLTEGLAAVRTGFVERSAFAFSPATLADVEPTIAFVALPDLAWLTVGYRGQESYGLVVTMGAPGHFFCAVESLGAVTGYGVGGTLDEVDSQAQCSQSTSGLPAFP